MNVKDLRTTVLAAFELAIKRLEEGKKISLSSDGTVKLCKSEQLSGATHTPKKENSSKRDKKEGESKKWLVDWKNMMFENTRDDRTRQAIADQKERGLIKALGSSKNTTTLIDSFVQVG
jgi:hypothetical protein